MTKLVIDIDFLLFAAASLAEETFITVTHRPTGFKREFDNRTAFYGHYKKKTDGWLGEQNLLFGNDFYVASDFDIVDGQRPRPFKVKGEFDEPDTFLSPMEGAQKAVLDNLEFICKKLGTEDYYGFTGRGKVFRHEIATLLPYKGNRSGTSPLILDELKQWAVDNHNISWVEGIEADDAVSIETVKGYKAWKAGGEKVIAVAIDKDSKQTEGWHFNPHKDKASRLIEGFGSLWLNDKQEPDGCGRMFLYWQMGHGDSTDNYLANCFSGVAYAGKGAYNDLVGCKNDKEAFEVLVKIFKRLYPQPKTVVGCKGELEIDWLHVMQEMATMAMMLRHKDDKIDVKATLTKLGVIYEH